MTLNGYRDFRIGVRVIDEGLPGAIVYTPWASQKDEAGAGWSSFAVDADAYDPDGVQLLLEVNPDPLRRVAHDFRLGARAWDRGEFRSQAPQATPWISQVLAQPHENGTMAWSGAASDWDLYDPDGFSVGLLTEPQRPIRGRLNFRVAARVLDAAGQGQPVTDFGQWQGTPTTEEGGGWAQIAFDKDRYDPDAFQVAIVLAGFQPT